MVSANTIFVSLPSMSLLAQSIVHSLGRELIVPEIIHFADGEMEIVLPDPALFKGKHVCIVHSTNPPVHENLVQILLLAHELGDAGSGSITALIPYFGYARHDSSKIHGGQGSIALMAKLLHAAGIHNVITVDIHNPMVLPSLVLPVYSIPLASFIAKHIKRTLPSLDGVCLVAPDQGAQQRVQDIARILEVGHIFFTKERYATDKTKLIAREGSCIGTTAIIIDDIIDTGGTAINVCEQLHKQGYTSIYGYFVHPVLSGNARERIAASSFTQVFISNTIPLSSCAPKIKIFDIAQVISEVLST